MYKFRSTFEQSEDSLNIKIESWYTPIDEQDMDYEKYIRKIHKKIKQVTYDIKDLVGYSDDYFINLDMRASGIKYTKESYMSCNIILFPEENLNIDIYLDSINRVLLEDKHLKYYQTKGLQ